MKKNIRKIVQILRDSQDCFIKERLESVAFEELKTLDFDVVLSYSAIKNELSVDRFNSYVLESGKRLYLPRVNGREMEFVKISPETRFKESRFGISEPIGSLTSYDEIWKQNPLVIVPGMAFTKEGYRLGYGGGFYDKFLSSRPAMSGALTLGICFHFQIFDYLEIDSHDVKVDRVLVV